MDQAPKRAPLQRLAEHDLLATAVGAGTALRQAMRVIVLVGLLTLGVAFWRLLADMGGAWTAASGAMPNLIDPGPVPTPVVPSGAPAGSPAPTDGETPTPSPAASTSNPFPVLGFEQASASAPPATLVPPVLGTGVPLWMMTPSPGPSPSLTPSLPPLGTPTPTAASAPAPASATSASDRAPWILLPEPPNGTTVAAGTVTVGARASGTAAIRSITLQVDGASVPVTMDQRSDTIWRGEGTVTVAAGRHTVQADVRDADGRAGSFTWTFYASSS